MERESSTPLQARSPRVPALRDKKPIPPWASVHGFTGEEGETALRRWQIYVSTPETWEAMRKDCEAARVSIDLESYIFEIDDVGTKFLELFKKKARAGVRVRILCDMVGSYGFFVSLLEIGELTRAGAEVRFFNPIRPWRVGRFFSWIRRDHRKILIVDSRVGYAGGVNIASRMREWRDTHLRLEDGGNGIVPELERAFERMWEATRERKLLRTSAAVPAASSFSLLTSSPHVRRRYVYRALLKAIRSAREYVYLTTPYFIPSVRLFAALRRAAKRGVDVRILIPDRSDIRGVDVACGAYITLALKTGIQIYLYKRTVLHAKTAVVDGSWATVGSANLDNISLFHNYECNAASAIPAFAEEVKRNFLEDVRAAEKLAANVWAKRPLYQKFLEVLTLPFHGIL